MSGSPATRSDVSRATIGAVALRLGLTSFGGPTAHLAQFQSEYVRRRAWLTEAQYAEVVALCQLMPGPSSSQTGAVIGYLKGGWVGAAIAWFAFTLPSAALMASAAVVASLLDVAGAAWVRALMCVAVAVVAGAVYDMGRTLLAPRAGSPAWLPAAIAVAGLVVTLSAPSWMVPLMVLASGAFGAWVLARDPDPHGPDATFDRVPSRRLGSALILAVPVVVLALWALSQGRVDGPAGMVGYLAFATSWAGSLVFGGGHVVLPYLSESMVPAVVSSDSFLAGYGLAQIMPGPLFSFSSFLGMSGAGVIGAVVAVVCIFAPGLALAFGGFSWWMRFRHLAWAGGAIAGSSAAVVGVLAAALFNPLLVDTIGEAGSTGMVVALVGLIALLLVLHRIARWPAWALVLVAVALAWPLGAIGSLGG